MSNISEQIRERFINSIPDIDEKDLKISIENTIKNCSVSNSSYRSSFFGASLRLFKFIGWKIWLVQGICLLLMLRIFIGLGGEGVISIPIASIRGLCIISATIPFITIPFIYRSFEYHMNEVEMSVYLSFGRQFLIKFLIIGIGDMIMLVSGVCVAVFILRVHTVSAVLYGMLPFLLLKTIILYVLSHHLLDNKIRFFGATYIFSVIIAEVFAKYYPVESVVGISVLICLIAILIVLIISNLRVLLNSVSYQELNLSE